MKKIELPGLTGLGGKLETTSDSGNSGFKGVFCITTNGPSKFSNALQ